MRGMNEKGKSMLGSSLVKAPPLGQMSPVRKPDHDCSSQSDSPESLFHSLKAKSDTDWHPRRATIEEMESYPPLVYEQTNAMFRYMKYRNSVGEQGGVHPMRVPYIKEVHVLRLGPRGIYAAADGSLSPHYNIPVDDLEDLLQECKNNSTPVTEFGPTDSCLPVIGESHKQHIQLVQEGSDESTEEVDTAFKRLNLLGMVQELLGDERTKVDELRGVIQQHYGYTGGHSVCREKDGGTVPNYHDNMTDSMAERLAAMTALVDLLFCAHDGGAPFRDEKMTDRFAKRIHLMNRFQAASGSISGKDMMLMIHLDRFNADSAKAADSGYNLLFSAWDCYVIDGEIFRATFLVYSRQSLFDSVYRNEKNQEHIRDFIEPTLSRRTEEELDVTENLLDPEKIGGHLDRDGNLVIPPHCHPSVKMMGYTDVLWQLRQKFPKIKLEKMCEFLYCIAMHNSAQKYREFVFDCISKDTLPTQCIVLRHVEFLIDKHGTMLATDCARNQPSFNRGFRTTKLAESLRNLRKAILLARNGACFPTVKGELKKCYGVSDLGVLRLLAAMSVLGIVPGKYGLEAEICSGTRTSTRLAEQGFTTIQAQNSMLRDASAKLEMPKSFLESLSCKNQMPANSQWRDTFNNDMKVYLCLEMFDKSRMADCSAKLHKKSPYAGVSIWRESGDKSRKLVREDVQNMRWDMQSEEMDASHSSFPWWQEGWYPEEFFFVAVTQNEVDMVSKLPTDLALRELAFVQATLMGRRKKKEQKDRAATEMKTPIIQMRFGRTGAPVLSPKTKRSNNSHLLYAHLTPTEFCPSEYYRAVDRKGEMADEQSWLLNPQPANGGEYGQNDHGYSLRYLHSEGKLRLLFPRSIDPTDIQPLFKNPQWLMSHDIGSRGKDVTALARSIYDSAGYNLKYRWYFNINKCCWTAEVDVVKKHDNTVEETLFLDAPHFNHSLSVGRLGVYQGWEDTEGGRERIGYRRKQQAYRAMAWRLVLEEDTKSWIKNALRAKWWQSQFLESEITGLDGNVPHTPSYLLLHETRTEKGISQGDVWLSLCRYDGSIYACTHSRQSDDNNVPPTEDYYLLGDDPLDRMDYRHRKIKDGSQSTKTPFPKKRSPQIVYDGTVSVEHVRKVDERAEEMRSSNRSNDMEGWGKYWPANWLQVEMVRGKQPLVRPKKPLTDTYWYSPSLGHKLRSHKEVVWFLDLLLEHDGDEKATQAAFLGRKKRKRKYLMPRQQQELLNTIAAQEPDVPKITFRKWSGKLRMMSAAVAYYLALSIFPMLLLLTSGLGIFLKYTNLGHDAEIHLLDIVAAHCSPSLESQIESLLHQFEDQSIASGPLGLVAAVLAAIGVFYQLERSFDRIWRIPPPVNLGIVGTAKRILTKRLVAFLLLLCVGVAIAGVLAINVVIGIVREWMHTWKIWKEYIKKMKRLRAFPHGLTKILLAQALAVAASLLSIMVLGDCHFVEIALPLREETFGTGLGFYFYETSNETCSWDSSKAEHQEYRGLLGSDWKMVRIVAFAAMIVSVLVLMWIATLCCLVQPKKFRYGCGIFAIVVMVLLHAVPFQIFLTEFCDTNGCEFGRTATFTLAAACCYLVVGILLFLTPNQTDVGDSSRLDDGSSSSNGSLNSNEQSSNHEREHHPACNDNDSEMHSKPSLEAVEPSNRQQQGVEYPSMDSHERSTEIFDNRTSFSMLITDILNEREEFHYFSDKPEDDDHIP